MFVLCKRFYPKLSIDVKNKYKHVPLYFWRSHVHVLDWVHGYRIFFFAAMMGGSNNRLVLGFRILNIMNRKDALDPTHADNLIKTTFTVFSEGYHYFKLNSRLSWLTVALNTRPVSHLHVLYQSLNSILYFHDKNIQPKLFNIYQLICYICIYVHFISTVVLTDTVYTDVTEYRWNSTITVTTQY